MDMYTRAISNIVFPIQERLKRHKTVAYRRRLEASQWLDEAELKHLQIDNLRRFLIKVNETNSFYKALFSTHGFSPREFSELSDLQILPFLTKEVIRKNSTAMKSPLIDELSRFNTGGSSGSPLIFFLGKERISHDVAAKWRATRWWGVDIGDREMVVWGSPIELGAQDRVRLLRDKLFRSELLSAFDLSEERMGQFIRRIQRYAPTMIFGYPSVISMLAEYAKERRIDLSSLGVKVVFVTSEKLYDHQRTIIEEQFCCPVANGYGSRDAGFIAHECPSGKLHICAEDILVEIVNEKGEVVPAGEVGEIVVTHTATTAFPFIRYKTGDMGAIDTEGCSCGRGLPVLKEVLGRTTDFVMASDGRLLHGLSLIYVLRDLDGIEAFKIIQNDRLNTRVNIVKNSSYDENNDARIVKEFRQRLGESVTVETHYCQEIEAEKSGKYRYVVSHAH
tara:strand:+ start:417 stop:1763 length:1347 start_codon:yes stop_codon:yes gene_type:complete